MTNADVRIYPLGEAALTVEFGQEISADLNEHALHLAAALEQEPFTGMIEAVPAYASTTVFYDVVAVRNSYSEFESASAAVKSFVESILDAAADKPSIFGRSVQIPVNFHGEDLEMVAEQAGLSTAEVISIFTSREYRVYMLGFLPGFAYMGTVDERIAISRRAVPRTRVAKGSVGIAGRQTGIYPFESPGGWQIIGTTPLEMFTPYREAPCLLQPGDLVKFTILDK